MFFLFLLVLFLFVSAVFGSERFEFEEIQMGVPVRIILYADSSENTATNSTVQDAAKDAFECFRVINKTMSDYDSDSELSQLSDKFNLAGNHQQEGVRVSDDLFEVLKSAKEMSNISDGAFDITISPLVRLWRRSRRQKELPKQQYLDQARQLVGNHLWTLDETTQRVRLLKPGMKLDLGGIAKGYAIDRAFEAVQKHGIEIILIDAGGDLRVGKAPPEGWKINLNGQQTVSMENIAMATSGDRFQFVEINNVRYSHLIDPKTGLGLTTSCTVHVTAPTAAQADALASAIAVLGAEKGIALIETHFTNKNVAVKIILNQTNQVFQSKNWTENRFSRPKQPKTEPPPK
ncbi:MAG: FAD:protein FMN transferase [Planctomycetaceae bacterium]|jgi:thiamine biosynthesis lipoprotein|nr:FAD:protein FMN transferase [Planctomycetaceae bacterium]